MNKKEKPVAICTQCGLTTTNSGQINQPCPIKHIKRGKCKGVYRSMISPGDWEECSECSATGYINNNECENCKGSGWISARKSF